MLIRRAMHGVPQDAELSPAERIIKPLQLADFTPQTAGVRRLASVAQNLNGSRQLWAGVMLAKPGSVSAVHHHGPVETVVFAVYGQGKIRWGSRLEHEADWESGDFLFIPPYLPHQEINTTPDRPTHWVVVRSDPEEVVVNLVLGPRGEYVEPT